MGARTDRADVVNATLEGVGHGLAQGIAAVESTGITAKSISLIGGGSRSPYWAQMLADLSGKTLLRREDGEVGPSLGAAQLAWMAVDKASAANTCPAPPLLAAHEPDPARHAWLRERHERFARLYTQVEPSFSAPA
jgi:xylulokinase